MGVLITDVAIAKNPVKTNEQFQVRIALREIVNEPVRYRLSFRLGSPKGNLGGAFGSGVVITPEPAMYRLPFNLRSEQGGIS